MGLLRKFVNGKVAAKIADVIAELATTQAFAALILRDIGRWLVIFIRDRRTVITALIAAIGPGAGVGQHDTSRKNSAVRFRRRGQYKRGTHRAQFAALLNAPAADHLLLRIGVTVSVDEVHRIQKTGVNLTPDHRSADQTLQIFRHPGDHAVQVRDFKRWPCTGSFAVHLKSASLNGISLILPPLPGDWFTLFVLLITEKITLATDLCQIDFPEHHAGRLLTDQLNKEQDLLEYCKGANAYYRKHKTLRGYSNMSDAAADALTNPDAFSMSLYRKPYGDFELTSIRGKIKRIQTRLDELDKVQAAAASGPVEDQHDGYTYRENNEIMRVQFIFPGKPDDETRAMLKENGFRWAPSQGAWQRQLTANAKYAAHRVMEFLDGNENE
mgnify:CR=1 FL=1